MNCKICYESFDLNQRRPFTLIPCGHCFCIVCLSRLTEAICPNCRNPIIDKKVNYSIIDFLEEDTTSNSNETETIAQFMQTNLSEISEKINKFNLTFQKKDTDIKKQFNGLRTEINSNTSSLSKKLITHQEILLKDLEKKEKCMEKKLNEIQVMKQQIEENMDAYSSYNLSIMSPDEVKKLREKFNKIKSQLDAKLESLDELKFDYELKNNEYMQLNHGVNILGEIVDRNQLLTCNYNQLVVGSDDKTVKLYDIETGALLKTLKGHHSSVNCVRFLSHTKVLSGSGDNTIRLWCVKSSECLKILYGHNGSVLDLLILPNNQLASTSVDKTIKIWELKNGPNFGKCIRTLTGHYSTIQCLALFNDDKIISGSNDTHIKIWQINSGVCLATLTGHRVSFIY